MSVHKMEVDSNLVVAELNKMAYIAFKGRVLLVADSKDMLCMKWMLSCGWIGE